MPTILDTLSIQTCAVSYGKEASFAGSLANDAIQVTAKALGVPQLRLVWAATGDIFSSFTDSTVGGSGTPGIIVLPQTGQTGFRHGTSTFKDWYYEAVVTATTADGQQLSRTYRFQIPAGTTTLDLDMLDEDGIVTAMPAIAPILAEPAGLAPTTLATLDSRYDAAVGVAAWTANTPYPAGKVTISPAGDLVQAKADFTSGATYTATNWTILVPGTASLSTTYAPLPTGTRNGLTGWWHVDGFGAKFDGTTDDTAAFTAAVNAAYSAAGGGTVYVKEGTTRAKVALKTGTVLRGTGRTSIIKLPDNANDHVIQLQNTGASMTQIRDLFIDGNRANQTPGSTADGINLTNAGSNYFPGLKTPRHVVQNVFIWNALRDGIHHDGGNFGGDCTFDNIQTYNCDRYGVYANSPDSQWSVLDIAQSGIAGIYIDSTAPNTRWTNCKVWFSGRVTGASGYGYYIGASRVQLAAVEAQDNGADGFFLAAGTSSNVLQAATADSNGQYVAGSAGFNVNGSQHHITGQSFDRGANTTPQGYGLTLQSGTSRHTIDLNVPTVATAPVSGSIAGSNVRLMTAGSMTNSYRSIITVLDAAGNNRTFAMWTNGSTRWQVRANGTAEGGSNAGSDFEIACYDDSGAALYTPIKITRSTGAVKFQRGTASTLATQTLAAAGAVTIDAASGDIHTVTLAANATSSSIINGTSGQRLTIGWVQDATGGRTYVWPTNCKFAGGAAPTASTLAIYRDRLMFEFDGTNWYEISRALAVH